MARGKLKQVEPPLFILETELPQSAAHPFLAKLNELFAAGDFDQFVENRCAEFYTGPKGRPSLAPACTSASCFWATLRASTPNVASPGVWPTRSRSAPASDTITDAVADHSAISRTRRLIDIETHQEVFTWALKLIAKQGLVSGKTAGIDATTLEANAAMRSIVRRDSGENYQEFLIKLAKESGIETPTKEDLAKIDKTRKNKASNDDWENPNDPDAEITKMKDGSTHLAHKAEHAVDMETGAILGDTTTVMETINVATETRSSTASSSEPSRRTWTCSRRPHECERSARHAASSRPIASRRSMPWAGTVAID